MSSAASWAHSARARRSARVRGVGPIHVIQPSLQLGCPLRSAELRVSQSGRRKHQRRHPLGSPCREGGGDDGAQGAPEEMATLDGEPIQHGEKCVSIIGGGRRLASQIARIAVAWRIPRDDMEHVGEGCELMAEALRGRPYSVQQHQGWVVVLAGFAICHPQAGDGRGGVRRQSDRSEFRQGPVLLALLSAPWANPRLRRRLTRGGNREHAEGRVPGPCAAGRRLAALSSAIWWTRARGVSARSRARRQALRPENQMATGLAKKQI